MKEKHFLVRQNTRINWASRVNGYAREICEIVFLHNLRGEWIFIKWNFSFLTHERRGVTTQYRRDAVMREEKSSSCGKFTFSIYADCACEFFDRESFPQKLCHNVSHFLFFFEAENFFCTFFWLKFIPAGPRARETRSDKVLYIFFSQLIKVWVVIKRLKVTMGM